MKTNIFGTDGIRGPIGIEPLTTESLIRLGMVIGNWATQKYAIMHTPLTILLGHDTRESCSLVKSALQTGLLHNNVIIHDAHVVPTPAIMQHLEQSKQYHLGIVISASHNPYYDNGIKIVDRNGKLSLEDELAISSLYYALNVTQPYQNLGQIYAYPTLANSYQKKIISLFPENFLSGIKVALDYAHGATYKTALHIFSALGAHVVSINDKPNGKNINNNCGALHLESLQQAVIEHQADAGFAFDGDGDRVIAVNKQGIVKNGDDILALLMHHPLYIQEKTIVGTVMSNQGFQAYVEHHNKKLIRVNVGDKYIAQLLEKDQLMVGGEQSGHIILRDYLNTGDGIFTALRVLESIISTKNWQMETFEKYPQVLINVPVASKKDLNTPFFKELLHHHESQLKGGRLLVRYSGTESLVRVMVEDTHIEHAREIAQNVSVELAQQLS